MTPIIRAKIGTNIAVDTRALSPALHIRQKMCVLDDSTSETPTPTWRGGIGRRLREQVSPAKENNKGTLHTRNS